MKDLTGDKKRASARKVTNEDTGTTRDPQCASVLFTLRIPRHLGVLMEARIPRGYRAQVVCAAIEHLCGEHPELIPAPYEPLVVADSDTPIPPPAPGEPPAPTDPTATRLTTTQRIRARRESHRGALQGAPDPSEVPLILHRLRCPCPRPYVSAAARSATRRSDLYPRSASCPCSTPAYAPQPTTDPTDQSAPSTTDHPCPAACAGCPGHGHTKILSAQEAANPANYPPTPAPPPAHPRKKDPRPRK